jgi:hypothetical protein
MWVPLRIAGDFALEDMGKARAPEREGCAWPVAADRMSAAGRQTSVERG